MKLSLDHSKFDQKFQEYTRELDTSNNSYIYGEVDYSLISEILLSKINFENGEKFLDIGSGCGKLIVGLATNSKFANNIFTGIEIHSSRYEHSLLLQDDYECHNNTEFILGDFNTLYFGNYNVLYCCNTIFGEKENNQLYTKIINEFTGYFILFDFDSSLKPYYVKTYTVNTSWNKKVFIHLFYKN